MFFATVSLTVLSLVCAAPIEFSARTDDSIAIAAEIRRPPHATALPIVIMLSGAGPYTRRYSTLTGSTEDGGYIELAEHLCKAGFSVVLFDERGSGASSGDYWGTATTARLATDLIGVMRAVPRAPEQDTAPFILLGHSEGGTIATLTAAASASVVGIVTLGAPATDLATVIDWQLRNAQQVGEYAYGPQLAEHRERSATELWYRSALHLDPLVSARRSCVPTLILHGTLDESVPVAHAGMLGASICGGRPGLATVRVLNGHDHSLTGSGLGDTLSVDARTIILAWLEEQFASRRAPIQSAP